MHILHEHQRCLFGSSEMIYDVHVEMAIVLTSTIQSSMWTLSIFLRNSLHICSYEYGTICIFQMQLASLLRFAYFGIRTCKVRAPQYSYFHLEDQQTIRSFPRQI